MSKFNNEDLFRKIIDENTKDVEWETFDINGEKRVFPFWKTSVAGPNDTYEDFLKWFKKSNKFSTDNLMGIVKPVGFDGVIDMKVVPFGETPDSVEAMEDLTGVVKPKVDMETKPVETPVPSKPKGGEMEDLTGVVKPKVDMETTPVDVPSESKLKDGEMEDLTGVVEPKADMESPKETKFDHDFSEPFEPIVVRKWGDTLLDQFKKLNVDL